MSHTRYRITVGEALYETKALPFPSTTYQLVHLQTLAKELFFSVSFAWWMLCMCKGVCEDNTETSTRVQFAPDEPYRSDGFYFAA